MLRSLVRFSIRFRGVVISLACLLAGYGIYALYQSKLDVFPEFAPPLAVIQTEAPGLSSEQVEILVTKPIENAMGGVLGLQTMQSKSLQGLSLVTMTFDSSTDIYRARQLAAERLGTAAGWLPRNVKPPTLLPLISSTGIAMVIGLTSDARSQMELRSTADWILRPHLLGLPGIAGVIVFGGDVQQLQIQVNPQKLVRYGLSLQDVLNAAQRATGVRGAGFLENANQRIVLHTEGQVLTPERLAQVVVTYKNGIGIHLGDVARVLNAPAPAVGAASIGNKSGVMLIIESQYGADTMTVTESVEQALEGLKPVLAADQVMLHPDIFRPANFIMTAIGHLRTALLLGGILVIAVLFLFLLNVRTAFISATAIPLSLLTAVIVLHYLGISLNAMTLGGLAIALGEVVDDAIVDVENILRRLRENQVLAQPLAAARVVLNASIEVRSSVVYATFIVVLIFLPVLTLSGVAGKLFAPLGIAYILAILASLGVALTLTPALAYVLLTTKSLETEDPRLVKALKVRYGSLLVGVEHHSGLIIAVIIGLCVAALATLPFLEGSFIPELKEGHYTVHMAATPGTSLSESMRIGRQITLALSKIPGVRLVAQRAGRATEVVDPTGVNISEFEVDLKPMSGRDQEQTLARIRTTMDSFPGLISSTNTFLTERIDETISGFTMPVIVNVFGNDLDILDNKAREIAQTLNQIPGAIGVSVQSPPGTPRLVIRLRQDQLTRYGFTPVDVLDAVQAAYEGVKVAQIYEGNRTYDVSVLLDPGNRQSPAEVGALPLRNGQGITVPLKQLADIVQSIGRYQIQHSGGQRLQTITSGVAGRAVSEFVKEAQARIDKEIVFSKGMYAVFAGEAQAQTQAQHDLLVNSIIAGIGIMLLLFMALQGARALMLVLVNLPFALVGGVIMVLVTGGNLTLGSLIGFVTLFGITLRNSIMLISHYEHLVNQEGMVWGAETANRGATERLVPILMTALVTALGLLPLALYSGEPGNEIEGPMAIVILGGLITSTVLNLLVLPTLALRFGCFEKKTDQMGFMQSFK
ncbi:efflux RND transporter permease subunit [Candidatus Nitrotoga sp. AM1P]|uniref:efflux RND transporter permease subunit n=1 Tax=Candidatus Nitrotoga sp. AM1P TaxID=2559597 RepID=UPI0010B9B63C|nr:efflux RND transporter permease subunit [Candidatus Nitrotoga sp. AM1P]BBJ22462.1 efflux RND transporter, permease subunit [Candidatus Nitrotoga sp. AM1P]